MPTLVVPTVAVGSLKSQEQPTLDAGDGVRLRPWVTADAPAVMQAYQDQEIQRWHVRRADSVGEAEAWITGWRDGWPAETEASWAVVDARADALLGRAACKALDFASGTAHVAYWTVPAARGKGICPRALETMVSWAFTAGFHRLDLDHAVGNAASCRVAEKTGFAAEGIRRSVWLQADGRHDAHVHARFRSMETGADR
ncbi:MAG TPA: GNAT family N-acetyltransferase [Micromonosporaceae bacterium]